MAVHEFIPIRLGRSLLVHATTIESDRKTICGKKCDGGIIEPGTLSCKKCSKIIEDALDRPKRAKRKTAKRKIVR